jgi:hypothetical protein
MYQHIPKKTILVILVTLIMVSGAFAYFSNLGSGTGTASVGNSSTAVLHGTVAGTLYPGASATVTFTVDNSSPGTEFINTIHLASIAPDAGHSGCSTTITGGNPDFTMADVAVGQSFPSGSGQAVTATGTLAMHDTGVNQDACQGATLTLNLTSS